MSIGKEHGGNLLVPPCPVKRAQFIKPSDIQRTAALIYLKKPPFLDGTILWHN